MSEVVSPYQPILVGAPRRKWPRISTTCGFNLKQLRVTNSIESQPSTSSSQDGEGFHGKTIATTLVANSEKVGASPPTITEPLLALSMKKAGGPTNHIGEKDASSCCYVNGARFPIVSFALRNKNLFNKKVVQKHKKRLRSDAEDDSTQRDCEAMFVLDEPLPTTTSGTGGAASKIATSGAVVLLRDVTTRRFCAVVSGWVKDCRSRFAVVEPGKHYEWMQLDVSSS